MNSDPSTAIEEGFRRIEEESMAGLPILNAALRVETVGFHRRGEGWFGIVITPWALLALIIPDRAEGYEPRSAATIPFPSGDLRFTAEEEPGIGRYLRCSLLSPVRELTDQQGARVLSEQILKTLLADEAPIKPPPTAPERPAPRQASRRQFLRAFLG